MPLDFVIPRGLSTLYRCSLTTSNGPRQIIPWDTVNQGLLQPQWELYHIQTIFDHRSWDQLLGFRKSFYETISSDCPSEFQAHSIFTRALILTGLELTASRTQSERRIDWANLTTSVSVNSVNELKERGNAYVIYISYMYNRVAHTYWKRFDD